MDLEKPNLNKNKVNIDRSVDPDKIGDESYQSFGEEKTKIQESEKKTRDPQIDMIAKVDYKKDTFYLAPVMKNPDNLKTTKPKKEEIKKILDSYTMKH